MLSQDQRSALDTLRKARLLEIAERFELDIAGSRKKPEVLDALARTRRMSFEDVLGTLTRDELKQICRARGLSDGGRDKQTLVDRLLGREAASARDAGPGYVPTEVAKPKRVGKRKRKTTTGGDDDGTDVDAAMWVGGTKSRLQRFALTAARGVTGRDADVRFAQGLIRCFGWGPDEELPAEMPAVVQVVDRGVRRERRFAARFRERRALVEIVDRDRTTTDAWQELMPLVLQLQPIPQYVVISNQRDLALYDLARSRTEVRLSIALDQASKYSEAFPFLMRDWSPGTTPQIINVERVSKEVADLVAKVYRSFKAEHPKRQDEVIRFTLQCIIAMFAEDIGLLPREHFTTLLYQGAEHGDAEARLRELFRTMSTPGDAGRAIRYFNGGLFANPVVLPIGKAQLAVLTKAAEANWSYVDPHIFGSVFQGIMDDAERHASGAHYTAKEDILRVVGPTIVEPWRRKIAAATGLEQLKTLRTELSRFRVLDPACGSGNFLYVAFREIYRLETEILAKLGDFAKVADDPKGRAAWGSGIPTTNFFGIDINPFAVELARATLNIAKKIAFDERRQVAAERFGQLELELDPSLPLDNLERNIVCDDALFCDWPAVDAIVGNPPILGDRKIRAELGEAYIEKLRATSGVDGVVDLSCYWFRRAHDRLAAGGRAGLVGTSGLRVGKARSASLDYIVERGGTITNAVSSIPWSGEAGLNVCMVNWLKGPSDGPHQLVVDGRVYERTKVPTHLQLHTDISDARKLAANKHGTAMGVIFGSGAFTSDGPAGFPAR